MFKKTKGLFFFWKTETQCRLQNSSVYL